MIPEGRSQKVVARSQAQKKIKIKLLHLAPDGLLQKVPLWENEWILVWTAPLHLIKEFELQAAPSAAQGWIV